MANKNQCYGEYDSATQTGWGPGYQYACIHSDSTEYSGGNTTWYNYSLATAGTIIDENTDSEHPATNITTAIESICPKGWTLPSGGRIRSIAPLEPGLATYIPIFAPVHGGLYNNGELSNESTNGYWWSSSTSGSKGARREYINYNTGTTYPDGTLYVGGSYRHSGRYIRCIQAS